MTVQPRSLTGNPSAVRFADNLFYRFEGDQARLGADLQVLDTQQLQNQHCSLQLWACESAYKGGEMHGQKIAQVSLPGDIQNAAFQQQTPAVYPAGQHDYAMVMALVSETVSGDQVIQDYVNFNQRQLFSQPQIVGTADARLVEGKVHVRAEQIRNPRDIDNMSGTMSLELWATREPYRGGDFSGHWLAGVSLGQLGGGNEWRNNEFTLDMKPVPAGGWSLVLMLREWTALGFVTRDYRVLPPLLAKTDNVAELKPKAEKLEKAEKVEVSPAKVAKTEVEQKPVAKVTKKETAKPETKAVSINESSEDELAEVKGLNAKLAKLIVAGRPYESVNDLVKVRGIGERMVMRLRTLLRL